MIEYGFAWAQNRLWRWLRPSPDAPPSVYESPTRMRQSRSPAGRRIRPIIVAVDGRMTPKVVRILFR